MSDFQTCFDWMMQNEDGPGPPYRYKQVPDPGGFAVSGINSASYPEQANAIAAMPQAERGPAVQAFYEAEFWNQWYEKLLDDELVKRVFDAAVNMGPVTAVKLLQKASGCPVDGHWGPLTVNAANNAGAELVEAFKEVRGDHYRDIVAANPQDAIYLQAWLARAEK